MTYDQPCDYCGGPTTFVIEISRLGDEPGRHVFACDVCKRSTWVKTVTQQQARQQQQGKKKE